MKKSLPLAITLTASSLQLASAMELDKLGMQLSEPEMQAIERSITAARQISRVAETKNGLPYRRDAHAKATGCVRATFSINPGIPERFRHSIFKQPGNEYKAWIRFSNGDMLVQPDSKGDARGMAIKVMNVQGPPIAPELKGPVTQDFIMTNTPAFFNRNIFDYADDIQYLAKFERTRWFISLFPPRLHPKQFYRAIQTVSSTIDTPLQPQYYSMLPYRLGGSAVKFSTRPCEGMRFNDEVDKNNPDFLHRQLADKLSQDAACFDFMVQEKVPGADMPIDDATAIWSEKASPFIPIARVHIPPQSIDDEPLQQFCENLSMNPWHGVGEWQPLGSLSKARRVVYYAVSQYRHEKNGVAVNQPDNWCVPGEAQPCTPDQGLLLTKSKWPLPRCFDDLYTPLDGKPMDNHCAGD
jgi:catalase